MMMKMNIAYNFVAQDNVVPSMYSSYQRRKYDTNIYNTTKELIDKYSSVLLLSWHTFLGLNDTIWITNTNDLCISLVSLLPTAYDLDDLNDL